MQKKSKVKTQKKKKSVKREIKGNSIGKYSAKIGCWNCNDVYKIKIIKV